MIRFFKHLFVRQRKKQLEEWLLAKYEPAIKYYNDSECFDPLSHLLIDLGETYMSISYNEKIKKDFGVSEQDFDRISRNIYDKMVQCYSETENLDYPLFIR